MSDAFEKFMGKSLRALVFCSDKIPLNSNSTSGGGLRSYQLMLLLRSLGFDVFYVEPDNSESTGSSSEFVFLGNYNLNNQASFVSGISYDLLLWCNPGTVDNKLCKNLKESLKHVDFHGPTNLESIHITGESLHDASKRIVDNLLHVDSFSFVSVEQKNYWMGMFSCAGFNPDLIDDSIVNLALPLYESAYTVESKVRFVFAGGWHPWLVDEGILLETADLIDAENNAELHFLGGAHTFCDQKYLSLVKLLKNKESIFFHGFLPHNKFLSFMDQSTCALDLFSKSFERKIAVSTRTVEFINNSIPVVHPAWSCLSNVFRKSGCGFVYEDKKDLFEIVKFISRCPTKLKVASALSKKAVQENFNFENARNSLCRALNKFVPEISSHNRPFNFSSTMSLKKNPSILWVTFIPEGEPLRVLRVETILYSLFKAGAIDGFGILSGNKLNIVGEIQEFDVVCLQREGTNNLKLRERIFTDKFILDIDDLLFANASYRDEGFLRWCELHFSETKELVEKCSFLSVTSERLSRLISEYTGIACEEKSRTTPNCLVFPRNINSSATGKAQAMIWTSSDFAALTESKSEITEACASLCREKKIPLFLFGKFSPELNSKFPNLRNFGMTNFLVHKQMLDEFNGKTIAVAPLETCSNKHTLDFIAGKSDLKMVEYGGHGIETIYSDSPPYRESDLLNRYVVGNNFQEWKTALEQAYENPSLPIEKIAEIRDKRDATVISMQNWLPLFIESRRSIPISILQIEAIIETKIKKPLIKRAWSKMVPKNIRKNLDPYLQPIFG